MPITKVTDHPTGVESLISLSLLEAEADLLSLVTLMETGDIKVIMPIEDREVLLRVITEVDKGRNLIKAPPLRNQK